MSDFDRIPPANLECEMGLLGAMMSSPEFVAIAEPIVGAKDFYAPAHEWLAGAIFRLVAAGKPVDMISVAEDLRGRPNFDRFGGMAYLASCTNSVSIATESTVRYYAEIVAEKAQLRRLIAAGSAIAEQGFHGESDVEAAIASAEDALRNAISQTRATTGGTTMMSAMRDVFSEIERATAGEQKIKALRTPWKAVNDMTGGFFPGELVVIASAPAQGKTAMVLNLADYVASLGQGVVAFFTLEMSKRAMSQRWLAMHSGVSARTQRLGYVRDDQWEHISLAISRIAQRGVRLFGRECASVDKIRREVAALSREQHVCAVIIDHVNFLSDADAGSDRATKHERLDRTYRKLLSLGDDFQTVTFAVQHMNRQGMNGRPTLSNIRDGGNPEGHAHAIIFPYRPDPASDDPATRCVGEFIVAKARDGEEGIVPMHFEGWRHLWRQSENDRPWFEYEGVA